MDLVNNSSASQKYAHMPLKPEEKTISMLIYLLGIFTTFLGPLILYVLKKEESEFINEQGKNYFNFMISYGIYITISLIFTAVSIGFIPLITCSIAFYAYSVIGMIAVNKGEDYLAPFSLKFMK